MIPSLSFSWKTFNERPAITRKPALLVHFVAGAFFQFVFMSAISCSIQSDRFYYGLAAGAVLPIAGMAIYLKYPKKHKEVSPREHRENILETKFKRRKSQEKING